MYGCGGFKWESIQGYVQGTHEGATCMAVVAVNGSLFRVMFIKHKESICEAMLVLCEHKNSRLFRK